MTWNEQVALAAVLAWLVLWIEHWFPLLLLQRRPHPIVNYTLGCLAIAGALTALYLGWFGCGPENPGPAYTAALWIVLVASGAAVLAAYLIDWLIGWIHRAYELGELVDLLQERIYGRTDEHE